MSQPVSKGRKVFAMISLLVLQTMCAGITYSLSIMYAEIIPVFQTTRSKASLVQGLHSGLKGCASLIASPIITKYGPGPSIAFGGFVSFAAISVNYFAESVLTVILTAGVIAGTGMSFTIVSSFVSISWIFHENTKVALVVLAVGSGLGKCLFPFLTEALIEEYQWRGTFLLLGTASLHCVPAALIIYTCKRHYKTGKETEFDIHDIVQATYLPCFKDKIIILTLLNSMLIAITGKVEQWFVVDIAVSRGFERSVGALLLSLIGVSKLIGSVIGVIICLKCRIRTVYHWTYLWPLLSITHCLVINMDTIEFMSFSYVLYGLLYGIMDSFYGSIMFEAAGLSKYPQALALQAVVKSVGSFSGTFLGGYIKDVYGSYNPMFYFSSAVGLCISATSIAVAYLHRKKDQNQTEEFKPKLDTPREA